MASRKRKTFVNEGFEPNHVEEPPMEQAPETQPEDIITETTVPEDTVPKTFQEEIAAEKVETPPEELPTRVPAKPISRKTVLPRKTETSDRKRNVPRFS